MTTKIKHLISATAITTFFIIAIASTDENQKEIEVAETEAVTPAIQVSPDQLYADYEANEVAADLKYKEKVLIVTGKVDEIAKDLTDEIYVTINTGEVFGSIQCFFATSHTNEAAGLKKGQTITIKGKCEGKMMNVLLRGCSVQ